MRKAIEIGSVYTLNRYPFKVEAVLRCLPKRRTVTRGSWRDKEVVVKFFLSRRADQHMRREVSGSRYLKNTKIKTPEVLAYGKDEAHSCNFVIYEHVPSNIDIEFEWMERQDEKTVRSMLFAMQDVVIVQHQNGLFYTDLHPHNFIFSEAGVHLTDTTDVRCENYRIALTVDKSLRNLVVLYAQVPPMFHALILEAFDSYCLKRGWRINNALRDRMSDLLYHRRCARMKRYLRKAFHSSSTFISKIRFFDKFSAKRAEFTDELQSFLNHPKEFLKDAAVIKNGRTCTGFRTNLNGKPVVVKQYNVKSFWHLIRLNSRESRAMRSWRNANAMQLLSVLTAAPIAYIEKPFWGMVQGPAYFVCEYLDGELLQNYLPKIADDQQALLNVSGQLLKILKILKLFRIVHGDLKATNFIIKQGKLYLIDLDGMKLVCPQRSFKKGFNRDLERFLLNWKEHSALLDYFRDLFQQQQMEVK